MDEALEVFTNLLASHFSCRQIAALPVTKQLAEMHINQFNILQGPNQMKQLGQFFRVLCGMWVTEDFIGQYTTYLDQLTPQI